MMPKPEHTWESLKKFVEDHVPLGTVISYEDAALGIYGQPEDGKPAATSALGQFCKKWKKADPKTNLTHRVVYKDGGLRGNDEAARAIQEKRLQTEGVSVTKKTDGRLMVDLGTYRSKNLPQVK